MTKYSSYSRPKPRPRPRGVHPVMRGIGCILMVVVPVLAYGAAVLLVNYGAQRGWPIPPSWLGTIGVHPLLLRVQGLRPILDFLQAQNNLPANLVVAVVLTVLTWGVLSLIYGYTHSLFGPPRYGPQDAPPVRVKVKRYKR